MSQTANILLFVIIANLLVGGFVLVTNAVRIQNRLFFLFLVLMTFWAATVLAVISSPVAAEAHFFIRLSNLVGVGLPLTFHFLCMSIILEDNRLTNILRRSRVRLAVSLAMGGLAMGPWTIREVLMPGTGNVTSEVPLPVYGPLNILLQGYIVLSFVSVIWKSIRYLKRLEGIRRAELQFTLLGVASGVFIAFFLVLVLPLMVPAMIAQQFGPLCVLPINLIIAYGIATHRILDVPAFLQRATAYGLLAIYLALLYIGVHLSSGFFLSFFGESPTLISHLLAAIIVAFSVSPVQGVLQTVSQKLFINQASLDIRDAAKKGNEIFASISTVDAILSRFLGILHSGGVDAEPLIPLISNRQELIEWALPGNESAHANIRLPLDSPLASYLRRTGSPISLDTVKRKRPTVEMATAADEMERLGAQLAVGILYKGTLLGCMLFGPRKSGRIYSVSEQDAVQLLAHQVGVALENANLYTEVQNNKIYNDILVDSLVSGVVAVDREGTINVFNREAQRITGLQPAEILGANLSRLPPAIQQLLDTTLETGQRIRDREVTLPPPADEAEEGAIVRLGSSLFHGANGEVLGGLLVMSDLTAHKKLEQQVRRSDRLASIGTLSAGMAHEIKNPLVTIKTFTELLPERYQDSDFRDTFAELVGSEVLRIDKIVNQLLHFARPAKADLRQTRLSTVIEDSLQLIRQQLRQKNIELATSFEIEDDTIRADAGLLDQALINFFLNAIDSMADKGGVLALDLAICTPPWHLLDRDKHWTDQQYLQLSIRDTGGGIASDALMQVFDPFYTTKSHGTGLGLAISHGIIREHHGVIDVESQIGIGTTFRIYFPLLRQEAAV